MIQISNGSRGSTPRVIPIYNGNPNESNAELHREIERLRADTEFQQKELRKYVDFWRAIQKCDADTQVNELKHEIRRLKKHIKQKDSRFTELLPLVFPTIAAWAITGVCLFIALLISM